MVRIDAAVVARAESTARALAPLALEVERARRLTPPAVQALVASGIPKIFVPRALGGAEASVPTALSAIEAFARADGSAGWCAMISATSGLMSAFLPDAEARRIFTADDAITAGVFAPMGRARAVEGGHRVSGRWTFGSGCQHASWCMGGALVEGESSVRSFVFPAAALIIHDTWDTVGMRGSGSHDFEVRDAFVPSELSFSLTGEPPRHPGPLYRQPFFGALAAGVAAVALGVARTAHETLLALAMSKQPAGSRRTLAHRELVQLSAARAEAMIAAARTHLWDVVEAAALETERLGQPSVLARARVRMAACHAVAESARAVDLAYEAGGGSSIYSASPLARCFRDVHVATQHVMVSSTSATMAGKALLGLELDHGLL